MSWDFVTDIILKLLIIWSAQKQDKKYSEKLPNNFIK